MLLQTFPDLEWLKDQAEKRFANKQGWEGRILSNAGWPTVILNVKTDNICRDNVRGPLSIFANLSGESHVVADKRRVKIKEGFFFVTNADQYYTLEVGKSQANTLNIHFGDDLCEEVLHTLSSRPEKMLDEENFTAPLQKINFHNHLHFKTPRFNSIAKDILTSGDDKLYLDEKLYDLMSILLEDHNNIRASERNLPVIKAATRQEIIRRLLVSTDFIYAFYDSDISLKELADVSCLSPFHFLRLFKLAFSQTPHQFINQVRTSKAKELLAHSKLEVVSISRMVGFRDSSSFSRMFFKQVGVYPSQYR
jgi:AraC family transcriptional regulator